MWGRLVTCSGLAIRLAGGAKPRRPITNRVRALATTATESGKPIENAPVVKLNGAIMKSFHTFNGDFASLDTIEWTGAPVYVAQAREVLRSQFSGSPLFGIKDPRMCRLWPIWAQALKACGAAIRFVVPVRHPVEVAQSLHSYGCSTNHGLMWWLAYTLDAERYSRTEPRAFVSYPDLLADPKGAMERIADVLGVSWPKPLDEVEPSLRTFLERSMRHRSQDSPGVRAEAESRILDMAEAVYKEMLPGRDVARLDCARMDCARMDCARAEFADLVKACRGWRPHLV